MTTKHKVYSFVPQGEALRLKAVHENKGRERIGLFSSSNIMVGCNYNVEETHEQRQPLEFLDWSKVQF